MGTRAFRRLPALRSAASAIWDVGRRLRQPEKNGDLYQEPAQNVTPSHFLKCTQKFADALISTCLNRGDGWPGQWIHIVSTREGMTTAFGLDHSLRIFVLPSRALMENAPGSKP